MKPVTQSLDEEETAASASREIASPASSNNGWWFRGVDSSRPQLLRPPGIELDETQKRRLADHLLRAVNHCIDTQDERGAWQVLPDARLFDTALVAYVLSRVPRSDSVAAANRAKEWLRHFKPQTHDPLARLLDETPWLILAGMINVVDLRSPSLYSNNFRRKTLLLYALGLNAGLKVLSPYTTAQLRRQIQLFYSAVKSVRMKQWSKSDLISIYILLEAFEGQASAEAVSQHLQSMQAPDGSFCHNPVSTALAFLALSGIAHESPAWTRCLRYLLDAQQPDGTWRFCTSDVWDTSLTIRAFCDHPMFKEHALKRAVHFVTGAQNNDGGWGFRNDVESDNDTSSCVLLALHQAGGDHSVCAKRAVEYLVARQRRDGLWNTWQSDEDHPVEDCVAHVIAALEAHRDHHHLSLVEAQYWLEHQYRLHGRWTPGWYRNFSYGVLEVSSGLRSHHPVTRTAIAALVATQNMDGGWPPEPGEDSSPSATGLAIAALTEYHELDEPFMLRGLHFLFDTQQNGTWPGQPELCGPRPLLCHFRTNTHAFAAYGLMAAQRKLTLKV